MLRKGFNIAMRVLPKMKCHSYSKQTVPKCNPYVGNEASNSAVFCRKYTQVSPSGPVPPSFLEDLHGFVKSQVIFAATKIGVFDFLHNKEPQSTGAISKALSTECDASRRLLDALVSIGMLEKIFPSPKSSPLYKNTVVTDTFLVKKSPKSLCSSLGFINKLHYKLFFNLKEAVIEGSNQWERTFNRPSSKIFESLFHDKDEMKRFLDRMDCFHKLDAPLVMSSIDLSSYTTMCDLGGGSGCFSYEASKQYPSMRITVFELPQVVQISSHFRPSLEECPNQSNVVYVAGDFFVDPLPSVDLFFLANIVHDWSQEKVDVLLKKVFEALPSGGGLLLGEVLLGDDQSSPFYAHVMDLKMLVTCERGARERSSMEYKQLLEKHGFVNVQTKITGGPSVDAIFATKR